jgi:hypothetical protein
MITMIVTPVGFAVGVSVKYLSSRVKPFQDAGHIIQ